LLSLPSGATPAEIVAVELTAGFPRLHIDGTSRQHHIGDRLAALYIEGDAAGPEDIELACIERGCEFIRAVDQIIDAERLTHRYKVPAPCEHIRRHGDHP